MLVTRRHVQTHKRFMLLASISILDAAVVRWPFAIMATTLPLLRLTVADVCLDLFLVPMIVWDLVSRGWLHPVTLWGGLALVAS